MIHLGLDANDPHQLWDIIPLEGAISPSGVSPQQFLDIDQDGKPCLSNNGTSLRINYLGVSMDNFMGDVIQFVVPFPELRKQN